MKSLLACLLLFTSTQAFGFGGNGHRLIANEAYERLGPSARQRLTDLFAIPSAQLGTSCPLKNINDAATWLDCVETENVLPYFKDIRHSEDLPVCANDPIAGKCGVPVKCAPGAECPQPCPSKQIEFSINYLKATKLQGPTVKRAQHMAVLFHLIGDIHQPQHAANTPAAGYVMGKLNGQYYRLHKLWDTELLDAAIAYYGPGEVDYRIDQNPDWRSGTQFDWVASSAQFSRNNVYNSATLQINVCNLTSPAPDPLPAAYKTTLSSTYIEIARSLEIRQVSKAAIRLEMVLEDVF